MGASSVRQDGQYEFRWTIATLAALTCCAVGLAAVIVLSATSENFDYRPAASALSRYDDELVQAFEALQTAEAARLNSLSRTVENPQAAGASTEMSEGAAPSGVGNQCSLGSWPYSSDNCRWAANAPKRPRIVLRLKSPWCSGALRHQRFYSCRSRSR